VGPSGSKKRRAFCVVVALVFLLWSFRFALLKHLKDTNDMNSLRLFSHALDHVKSQSVLSVAQFNILSSNLAEPCHFGYVKPEYLDWSYRREVLLRQIKELKSDILCFEELDNYWTYFRKTLEGLGYDSVYVKRPSIHSSSWSGLDKQDGCGIFFHKDKFNLINEQHINFKDIHDRVALILQLQNKQTGNQFIVCNTHLYWDPKKIDDQLQELKEIEQVLANNTMKNSNALPLIFCGDFNNTPQSKLYRYMSETFLRHQGVRMRSAYDVYTLVKESRLEAIQRGEHGAEYELPYSSINFKRQHTIDYIWYSEDLFELNSLLDIPSEVELKQDEGPPNWVNLENEKRTQSQQTLLDLQQNHNGIPNSRFGSDHIPLLAVFREKKQAPNL